MDIGDPIRIVEAPEPMVVPDFMPDVEAPDSGPEVDVDVPSEVEHDPDPKRKEPVPA